MNETCDKCGESLDGQQVTKIVDGSMTRDGEFEHMNTWTYHNTCVSVSTA